MMNLSSCPAAPATLIHAAQALLLLTRILADPPHQVRTYYSFQLDCSGTKIVHHQSKNSLSLLYLQFNQHHLLCYNISSATSSALLHHPFCCTSAASSVLLHHQLQPLSSMLHQLYYICLLFWSLVCNINHTTTLLDQHSSSDEPVLLPCCTSSTYSLCTSPTPPDEHLSRSTSPVHNIKPAATFLHQYFSNAAPVLLPCCTSGTCPRCTRPAPPEEHLRRSTSPEPPKIHLDCSGETPVNTIIVVAGNKLRFDVPITGEPAPTVTWFQENVEFTEIDGRVHIEPKPDLSSFVIDGAKREDEGNYKIIVTNPSGQDNATLYIKVVDIPDPPQNVKIVAVGEDWADVVWDPPKYDGGQEIQGYYIERKKKGSQRWMKMNFDVYTDTKYQSTNMIEGVLYEIRIFAVNAIGISQEANTTNPFMPIAPTSEPQHLTVEDVTDTTCTLKWRPPDRIGAGGIDGYLIEYCKEGSDEWVEANTELVERCGYTAKGLPTGEKLFFRVRSVNIAGKSEPVTLGQPVTIREIVQSPKIRLPRQLRQTYIKKVGEQVNLLIPFQGKPRPKVTWTKDGQPLDPKQVSIRTSECDTILFIRSSERSHSGKYDLTVQIENMVDSATISIRIVDKPGPAHAVMVKEVWGFNALLEWQPPKDNGNSDITGYTIQKADKKTMEWFNVYEHNRQPRCTVSDLIMGNEYYFRVYSENIVGLSDAPGVSKNTAIIEKTGLIYKPRDYNEMDINEAPKFLTPLTDRVVVAGYSTALNCAVRGHPKPRVIWMKNKMEIKDDPKFLMKHNQGVLTLNIRKPSPFDGGTYTCKAINDLGEAEVDCKLEVRVPQ